MKRVQYMFWTVLLVCILPALLMLGASKNRSGDEYVINLASINTNPADSLPTQQPTAAENPQRVSVLRSSADVIDMPLEDYVFGVVLAEMPHWFEPETLKAQAVVARTYTLRRGNGNAKHIDSDVCTDPSCCQGYCDENEYLASGGTVANLNKIKKAVKDTENMVLVYNGELIEATYFSCSGGYTEDAAAVWGADVPYLQATVSPGEENADHYTDLIYLSGAELEEMLGRDLPGSVDTWFGDVTYTKGGGVDTIRIGGQAYLGTEMRKTLGLFSTAFSISTLGDTILITTKGYGHRVGMSQFGADAMAVAGSTFEEILLHYYTGTQLVCYNR